MVPERGGSLENPKASNLLDAILELERRVTQKSSPTPPKRSIDRKRLRAWRTCANYPTMCYFASILSTLLIAVPAMSVELFRYRGAAKDGGTLEYVFEAGEQNSPNAVTKEKAAEIAADFMTTFYHVQVGALETQEFRTTPLPFWLICFSDTVKGPRPSQSKGPGSFAS
jgi:hypothetical protein